MLWETQQEELSCNDLNDELFDIHFSGWQKKYSMFNMSEV